MEPSTSATPAPADTDTSSAMGNAAVESIPDKPARAEFHGAHLHSLPLRNMIKDSVVEQPERRDSCDSMQMSFSQHRTNTGWSVASAAAASVFTDYTEPESPDPTDEDLIFDADPYASSPPRPASFLSRSGLFCPPSRASSFASNSSDSAPLSARPRLGRFAEMTSSPRRARFERVPFGQARLGPGQSSRRESVQIPYSPILEDDTPSTNTERDMEELGRRSPSVHEADDHGRGVERAVKSEEHEPAEGKPEPASGESEFTTDEDTPDSTSDAGFAPSQGADDGLVQDFLDRALRHVFGVDIAELEHNAASAAYESVNYCLDELAYIVRSSGMHTTAGPSHHETAREATGSKNIAIQPANPGNYGGKSGNGNKKKRLSDGMDNGDGDADDDDDDHEDRRPPNGKKQKTVDGQNLSCPFRKRNPTKFNVRDFQSCAVQSFPDIPQLKRHIKNFHRQRSISQFTCPRCMKDMGTQEGLISHQQVDRSQMCEVRAVQSSANPEDGITSHIEDILNGRKANSKVDCWRTLWNTLFPDDTLVLDHNFVPPTELDEVYKDFKDEFDHADSQLRQQILREFPEEADRLLGFFAIHTHRIVEACRSKTSGSQGRPRRTRNQGPKQSQGAVAMATAMAMSTGPTSPVHTRRSSLTHSIHRMQSRDTINSFDNSGGFPSSHGTPMSDDAPWPTPSAAQLPQLQMQRTQFTPSPVGYNPNAISPIVGTTPSITPLRTIPGQPITVQPPPPMQYQHHAHQLTSPNQPVYHHRALSDDSAVHLDTPFMMAQIGGNGSEVGFGNLPVRTGQQQHQQQHNFPSPVDNHRHQVAFQQMRHQMQHQMQLRPQQRQDLQMQIQMQAHQHPTLQHPPQQGAGGSPINQQLMAPQEQQGQAFFEDFDFDIPGGLGYGNEGGQSPAQ
ncbi:hypothetical protein QBC35DRAFT_455987 [Podospora australis]|uniref:C2H2-type domain-containing protein n=1 Tax=Podospora australis TaxID=1536484 RepID=A0AAN6WP26_9PEZI|nr:hypothetical protein QBC35DRAFT_455987 [Podospora australis]